MNVAILADNLTFGGVNRYCLDLTEGLKAYPDVKVSLLALPDQSAGWLRHEADVRGVQIQILPMRSTFDVRVVQQLRTWLAEQRVDVLHSQDYRSNAVARLAVRLGRLPTRLVCTMHGMHYFPAVSLRLRLFFALDYLSMYASDRIIAVSKDTYRQLTKWGMRGRTRLIHNGAVIPRLVDAAAQRASRQALGIPPDAKTAIFIGRLTHQKGPGALADVARRTLSAMDNVVFLIVGDGPLMSNLQESLQDLFPRVVFLGYQRDVTPFYNAADVLLLPSRYEGLPMTLVEAFAHGVPAVASNVGGIPEVIQDGANGFMCDPMRPDHMCERISQLLRDDTLRQRFGAHARGTVEANFSLERMSAETYRLYRELEPP